MTSMDLHVSPLGRVEGDLDVRVTIEDGVVTSAWTEAAMFRGFEIILRGKDPQAGLIMTPRICGICGGGCSIACNLPNSATFSFIIGIPS